MPRDSHKLVRRRPAHLRGLIPHLGLLSLLAGSAQAQPSRTAAAAPAAAPGASPLSTDLSGYYLALGPVGSATRVEGTWDGGFGGELSLARVDESRRLVGLGLWLGGIQYTERSGGRLWLDGFAGWRSLFGVVLGLSAGGAVELDQVRVPRWGAQLTCWAYVGVIPYVRVGTLERGGPFVDAGLKIPLPALRW